jgi:predicted ArsR family transcriptional regulator
MNKTKRYRIIEYIREKKLISASELAYIFRITAADARYHLAALENEGVVVVVDTRVYGRGRPTQMYRLSSEINRHNLDALVGAILTVWYKSVEENQRDDVLNQIAVYLTAGCTQPKGNLTQRLTNAVRQLNGMNYLARWEAHLEAPRILISHCPYAMVVQQHPETCQLDAFVIEKVLGQSVTRISIMDDPFTGEKQCVFRLEADFSPMNSPAPTM